MDSIYFQISEMQDQLSDMDSKINELIESLEKASKEDVDAKERYKLIQGVICELGHIKSDLY